MTPTVAPADPRAPAPRALIAASRRLMQALFEPEDNHDLAPEELAAPGIRFFEVRLDGRTVGCAALALRPGYGELKAMYVDPAARGRGAADALMARLEAEARAEGLAALRLETGDRLAAARRFYARHGFAECGPFGAYTANATSVFLSKPLSPP